MMEDRFFDVVGTAARRAAENQYAAPSVMNTSTGIPAQELSPIQRSGAQRWASSFDKFFGAHETYDQLPAGIYRCGESPVIGIFLERKSMDVDELLEFPDNASNEIIAEFDKFWSVEPEFRKRGFLHKRGFLLWGPPGSGKTSTINMLISKIVRKLDGIVVLVEGPRLASACLALARSIEPKRPMVCIIEDMDAIIERHGENELLALLDGEAQVDSVVFVATTNYPERLDRRFVDRPSRFDTIKYIGMPSAAARRMYLMAKEQWLEPNELDAWVAQTQGFSVAHLKELIIAVRCLGQDFGVALERLENMRRRPSSDDSPDRVSMGLLGGRYNREAAE